MPLINDSKLGQLKKNQKFYRSMKTINAMRLKLIKKNYEIL